MSTRNLFLALIILWYLFNTGCGYLQVNPPPDVNPDITQRNHSNWQAAAANMLATAGYGEGKDIQLRADLIYSQINNHFGNKKIGWTDAALEWWLNSEHNLWPSNPYKIVDVIGHKRELKPYSNENLPQMIGELARKNHIIAVSVSWPQDQEGDKPSGGHVLNFIGDSQKKKRAWDNPGHIRVTDGFRNIGGAIQTYPYDKFAEPNPNGLNNGNGWYIEYDKNHPFIKNIIILSKVDKDINAKRIFNNLSSYRVKQPEPENANAFKFVSESDSAFLGYEIFMDRYSRKDPTLMEKVSTDSMISVEWNLSGRNSADGEWLTISTRMALPGIHKMTYRDVQFEYGNNKMIKTAPDICWKVLFDSIRDVRAPNITGGYLVGSIEIIDPDTLAYLKEPYAELRFMTRYDIHESLLYHKLILCGEQGYQAGRVRMGNSFGKLNTEELWQFEDWLSTVETPRQLSDTFTYRFNWGGMILYPEGENFYKKKPELTQ